MDERQLWTDPDSIDVTANGADTLTVPFASVLRAGETLASAVAVLYRTEATSDGSPVAGFVTSAVVSTTNVVVTWAGSVLTKGEMYVLRTAATLASGKVVPQSTTVRCVA